MSDSYYYCWSGPRSGSGVKNPFSTDPSFQTKESLLEWPDRYHIDLTVNGKDFSDYVVFEIMTGPQGYISYYHPVSGEYAGDFPGSSEHVTEFGKVVLNLREKGIPKLVW